MSKINVKIHIKNTEKNSMTEKEKQMATIKF